MDRCSTHIYTRRPGQLEEIYRQIDVNMPVQNGVLPAQLAAAAVSSRGKKKERRRVKSVQGAPLLERLIQTFGITIPCSHSAHRGRALALAF